MSQSTAAEPQHKHISTMAEFEFHLTHVQTIVTERTSRDQLTEDEYQTLRAFLGDGSTIWGAVNHILNDGAYQLRRGAAFAQSGEQLPMQPG